MATFMSVFDISIFFENTDILDLSKEISAVMTLLLYLRSFQAEVTLNDMLVWCDMLTAKNHIFKKQCFNWCLNRDE